MAPTTLVRCSGAAATAGGTFFMLSMLTPMRGLLRAGVPTSVVALALGAAGLYAALHGRRPGMERLGLLLAATGLLLGLVGMTGSALGIIDPNPVAPVINTGEHVGLIFIGAGMVTWGVVAVQTRALGRWSFTPIPIGVCGLAGFTVFSPATFHVLEGGLLPILFCGSWILLGLGLLLRDGSHDPAKVVQA